MKQTRVEELDSLVFEFESIDDVIKLLESYKSTYANHSNLRLDSECCYVVMMVDTTYTLKVIDWRLMPKNN